MWSKNEISAVVQIDWWFDDPETGDEQEVEVIIHRCNYQLAQPGQWRQSSFIDSRYFGSTRRPQWFSMLLCIEGLTVTPCVYLNGFASTWDHVGRVLFARARGGLSGWRGRGGLSNTNKVVD